jgi:hypothetical protein
VPDLGCSPSAVVAYDYLIGRGLRDFQAAAVVGNLQQESKLDPTVCVPDPDPAHLSCGIAQWQPPRWRLLLEFAERSGRSPWALDTQLDFLWHELQSTPYLGLQNLLASATLENAVVVFQNEFERPKASAAATANRIRYAQSALYACPSVVRPTSASRGRAAATVVGVLALVAAAGYGILKFRPKLPRFQRPDPHPDFDYRSRL